MRRVTYEAVPRNSMDDYKFILVTGSFKWKIKTSGTIIKFKAWYCVIGDVQKIMYPENLETYSTVVQWDTVRLIFILNCILGLQSQIIDSTNDFYQADIPVGGKSSLNFPGISIVMEGNVMLFSYSRKSYMVNLKPHASGIESCKISFQIMVLWW